VPVPPTVSVGHPVQLQEEQVGEDGGEGQVEVLWGLECVREEGLLRGPSQYRSQKTI